MLERENFLLADLLVLVDGLAHRNEFDLETRSQCGSVLNFDFLPSHVASRSWKAN